MGTARSTPLVEVHMTRLWSFMLILALVSVTSCGDEDDGGGGAGDAAPPNSGQDVVLVCSDENSDDNRDMDGDGFSPCDGDCNDADTAFYPGAPDVDGDRIDNNCDNWMPQRT
ncbi:MAG: putative metal-binding motif-containing protein [Myxococcales bacterium]|nr:putative metal-binding motif-containing protein [Myxococcales bacterium]